MHPILLACSDSGSISFCVVKDIIAESFLATAYELEQEFGTATPRTAVKSDAEKADLPVRRTRSPSTGTGSATLRAVSEVLRERGSPMAARELLPLVLAKGVVVGGKSQLATLSARISQKGIVESKDGKWWFIKNLEASGAGASGDEAAEQSGTEQSAASLFGSNSGDQQNAAALVS